jgi:large subunit ribosomal protein L10
LLRPEKIDVVAEIKDRIAHHEISILARYIGITVEQVTLLRKKLREQGIVLKVYKNTLAKRALDELGLSEAVRFIEGPTAWAFSKDPVAPAKVLKDFAKDVEAVGMSGGILSGRIVTKEQLHALAGLPPREVLLAQVAGTIAAPLRNLLGALNAVPRNLVNVLDQIRKQKEEQQAA